MAEDKQPHRSRFHKAKDDAQFARQATTTPQTAHPAYRLAFQDNDFLLREDLRPVRFLDQVLWAPGSQRISEKSDGVPENPRIFQ